MSKILIDQLRIDGFRGLTDFKMSLFGTTVLTGMNNVGKTSVLKALQLVFGNASFLNVEDLHIENNVRHDRIIVDVRIIPTNDAGIRIADFDDEWAMVLKAANIKHDVEDRAYVAFRSIFEYTEGKGIFTRKTENLIDWEQDGVLWTALTTTTKFTIPNDQLPFFYIDARRDIIEDLKLRNSYLGRMLSEVSSHYTDEQVSEIEHLIEELNRKAISDSEVLVNIQSALSGLNSTMDRADSTVSILPFTKKIRDLNKSLSIQYGSTHDTFTMDYHGMGTRSWSSLLTFKAFMNFVISSLQDGDVCCPIIAIEEPESHLHPNAQKQLYAQMIELEGLKLISTHSPYVAACARLSEIRNIYKDGNHTIIGMFDDTNLSSDDIRNVERQVILSHGELLFCKAMVLFEGETEAIALPIYAEKAFGAPAFIRGIDFVGVGGYGFYAPYVRFAKAYNIPWFIFSDGESDAINGVKNALRKALNRPDLELSQCDNVFIIPDNKDYESYITSLNYLDAFKNAHKKYIENTETDPRAISGKKKTIDKYTAQYYNERAHTYKTTWASIMANAIVGSGMPLPPVVNSLFEKVKDQLSYV